jgi:hypothetical protein
MRLRFHGRILSPHVTIGSTHNSSVAGILGNKLVNTKGLVLLKYIYTVLILVRVALSYKIPDLFSSSSVPYKHLFVHQ